MAKVAPLQREFNRMVRDLPRYQIPRGSAWNLQDFIPSYGANLRKRGGFSYYSNAIAAQASGATYVNSLFYAPFASGAKVCALTDNSKFVTVAANGTVTLVTASGHLSVAPWGFHKELVIIPVSNGSTAPRSYNGTTYGALAGSPPAGKYVAVWQDYTIISGNSSNTRHVYFSEKGDPTSATLAGAVWDTTESWLRMSQPVTGLAALPNVLLIFSADQTARVRGFVAPPGGDFITDDPVFNVGCTDARSIVVNGPYCIFANNQGVYISNGTNQPEDLTASCGLTNHWLETMASYTSSYTICGGIYRGLYFCSIMNGATFVDSYVLDPVARAGWRNTNFKFTMMAPRHTDLGEELFCASRAVDRVVTLSSIYSPAAGVKADADGTAVTPILETPFYSDLRGSKDRIRQVFTHYDLRDAASDNPVITVSYITEPDGSYTALSSTLGETSGDTRTPLPIRKTGYGLGLKLAQTNASSETKIVAVEAEIRDREPTRH